MVLAWTVGGVYLGSGEGGACVWSMKRAGCGAGVRGVAGLEVECGVEWGTAW